MAKASILLLTYNQEKFVSTSLLGALNQDFDDYEIIVADDGSTDRTMAVITQIVATHARRHLVRYMPKETNMGLVRNWNRAVAAAKGEILVGMAGDDISSPDRLAVTSKIFEDRPEVMVVMSQVSIIDEAGNESIGVRSVCYLPMTYDHRLIDGADAGRFLTTVRRRLEEGAFEAELGL